MYRIQGYRMNIKILIVLGRDIKEKLCQRTEVYLCYLGCVVARHMGRAVGGAVEGGVVDVMCTAGGAPKRRARHGGCLLWSLTGQRGPKGEGDGRCLVVRFLREHWQRGQRRQRGETRGGFLLSMCCSCGSSLSQPLAASRGGEALERRRSRGGGEVLLLRGRWRGAGEMGGRGRSWGKQRTGTCLARASARLQVWSSAGKPSAGGGALPKKGQGRRRFVSSGGNIRKTEKEIRGDAGI
ncbi:hypothetical protein B0H14DRAFT_3559629 [Mycena olivaceomarginata]|nr:hypothetical protein B0H14DRAFT_3559629 [Mycena olivaceomarginata]